MNKLQAILDKFPHYYQADGIEVDEDNPQANKHHTLYGIVKAFADELELLVDQIRRADDMVGIDTTHGEDLQYRWGSLLNLPRMDKETDLHYRVRLKNSVNMLRGGTAKAIQFAIAAGLGISHNLELMEKRIQIYDAWEYTGSEIDEDAKVVCHIVCCVDLDSQLYGKETEQIIFDSINKSKAAGIAFHFLAYNYRILYYYQLDDIKYEQLNTLSYSDLGV